jgi:hypothetical protein
MSVSISISTPPLELKEVNNKIIDDSVKEYDDPKELVRALDTLKLEDEYVISEFKDLLIMLTDQLASIYQTSAIGINRDFIITQIKEYSRFFIDGYIDIAYNKTKGVYRKHLVEQNEEFFLNNKFDDISNGKNILVSKLFIFKDFWSTLKEENKKILKFYLTTMCCYTDIRYINWNRYLMIKHMNPKYKDLYKIYDDTL